MGGEGREGKEEGGRKGSPVQVRWSVVGASSPLLPSAPH